MIHSKRIGRFNILISTTLLFALFGFPSPYSAQLAVPAHAATPVTQLYGSAPDEPDNQLQSIVEDVVGNLQGTWGVAIKKLDTGQYAAFNGDTQQVSASLYKLWVLNELYRQVAAGVVSMDDTDTVTSDDAYYDSISGDVHISAGDTVSLRQAARLMITVSDNTSASLLVRTLGPDNINRFMRQNGLTHSYLDWWGGGDNLTTPLDMLREMEMIATSGMVSAQSSREMINTMLDQQIDDLLPVGLPDGTPFAHKTGALDSLLHDAGIVYSPTGPYVIVVMSSYLDNYDTAHNVMSALSQRVYNYFASRPSSPALYFPETTQSVGHDFLKFWFAYGGIETFGYPIAPEQLKDGVLVQQFERARFELRAENANDGGGYTQVGLGLLGTERANQLGLSWSRSPDPGTGKFFPQTGQAITGAFYDYWLNNGGARLFGYPISPAADMVSPADSKTYTTQWFERARMEIHPDLPAGHRIVLGTLGREVASPR